MTLDPVFTWPGYRADDPAHQQLRAFLVMDIQQSPAWAQEIVEKIMAVRSQQLGQWQRLGNAYVLNLSLQGAQIEDTVTESSQTVLLEEFEAALRAWQGWIQHNETC
ncbi:MAG: hypothetical protein AAGG51_13575 [Cyanobacteria bacterium P01_G01_bin.54]